MWDEWISIRDPEWMIAARLPLGRSRNFQAEGCFQSNRSHWVIKQDFMRVCTEFPVVFKSTSFTILTEDQNCLKLYFYERFAFLNWVQWHAKSNVEILSHCNYVLLPLTLCSIHLQTVVKCTCLGVLDSHKCNSFLFKTCRRKSWYTFTEFLRSFN